MIFERVWTRGFGRFGEMEIPLDPGMNVLFGPNEAGKTTVAEAIFAVLYGQADRSGSRKKERPEVARLEPWQGGEFRVGADLRLFDGRRFLVDRRLGTKEDLEIFDPGIGQSVTKGFLSGKEELGEKLTGIPAGLFRQTVFVPQLSALSLDGEELSQRLKNLEESGRDDTSLGKAMDILEDALSRLGKSDGKGRATAIGQALQKEGELDRELGEMRERRTHFFESEGQLGQLSRDLPHREGQFKELEARLQGAEKRIAGERLATIASVRGELQTLEDMLRQVTPLASLDLEAITALEGNVARGKERLENAKRDLLGLDEERTALEAGVPFGPGREWADQADEALVELAEARAADAQAAAARSTDDVRKSPAISVPALALGSLLLIGGLAAFFLKAGLLAVGGLLLLAIVAFALGPMLGRKKVPISPTVSKDAQDAQERRQKAQTRLRALATEAGLPEITRETIRFARDAARNSEQREALLVRLQTAVQAEATLRDEVERQEKDLLNARRELPEGASATDIAAARQERQRLDGERKGLEERLHRLAAVGEEELLAWAERPVPTDDGDPDLLRRQVDDLRSQVTGLRASARTLEENLKSQRALVGDLPEKEGALQSAKQDVVALKARRDAVLLAQEVLGSVGETFHRDVSPRLNAQVAHWLGSLSRGRYGDAAISQDGAPSVLHPEDGRYRTTEDLSQGTRDMVYLAMRFALVELLPDAHCPLILDDPCVNLDADRTDRVLATLAEVSKERQVLLFTCHEREAERALKVGANVIRAPWTEKRAPQGGLLF